MTVDKEGESLGGCVLPSESVVKGRGGEGCEGRRGRRDGSRGPNPI